MPLQTDKWEFSPSSNQWPRQCTNSTRCEKREAHNNWSLGFYLSGQHLLIKNYHKDYWPCGDGLSGGERHRYAIARPHKLGTNPIDDGVGWRLTVHMDALVAGSGGKETRQ